jgi:hypothetical protein
MGELDVKLGDVQSSYVRQTLTELQGTAERLRQLETSLGPARRLLEVKARAAGSDDAEYTFQISRVRDGAMVTFDATKETMLTPGDVVEVKLKRRVPDSAPSLSTQAILELDQNTSVAQDIQATSK